MKPNHRFFIFPASVLALALFAVTGCKMLTFPAPQPVTLKSLLDEMTDCAAISRLPSPVFTCVSFSSYDRASNDLSTPKTRFANNDCNQFIRVETNAGRRESVLMDDAGPGALVRFWTTGSRPDGVVRIYLDASLTPQFEGTVPDLFSSKFAPSPLVYAVAHGRAANSYLPIPYAQHCKVTYQRSADQESFYYNLTCRRYAPGTHVLTLTKDELAAARSEVAAAAEKLAGGAVAYSGVGADVSLDLPAGATVTFFDAKGPAAISSLSLATTAAGSLRDVSLLATFDGEPCVNCPVLNFIGTDDGAKPCQTWRTKTAGTGDFHSFWFMPFSRAAKIELRNNGTGSVRILGSVSVVPNRWDSRSLHFHAITRKHDNIAIEHAGNPESARLVNYADLAGAGVYAGDALALVNRSGNEKGMQWWGEGDEEIFVDGEAFPSHFGTGSEDYYGYGWGDSEEFDKPFHAEPIGRGNDGPGLGGHTVNLRWRGLDAIPYTTSLRFDMELWTWGTGTIDFTPTVFWYARPGGASM